MGKRYCFRLKGSAIPKLINKYKKSYILSAQILTLP